MRLAFLLESLSLRLSIVPLLGALAVATAAATGCAKDNGGGDQGNAAAAAPPAATPPAPAQAPGAAGPVAGVLDRSHAGTPAPAFDFQDGEGRPTSMAAFRGKPTLVNLWATWCAPCIIEMPSLDALAVREGEALNVVALSQDLQGRNAVTRFFAERGFRALEANLDPDMRFMTDMRLETLPTTILYDADGKEVWRMVGRAEWDSDRVARLLDEAEGG
jgi:thiol-disulfide isomerase/thioredoxin